MKPLLIKFFSLSLLLSLAWHQPAFSYGNLSSEDSITFYGFNDVFSTEVQKSLSSVASKASAQKIAKGAQQVLEQVPEHTNGTLNGISNGFLIAISAMDIPSGDKDRLLQKVQALSIIYSFRNLKKTIIARGWGSNRFQDADQWADAAEVLLNESQTRPSFVDEDARSVNAAVLYLAVIANYVASFIQ